MSRARTRGSRSGHKSRGAPPTGPRTPRPSAVDQAGEPPDEPQALVVTHWFDPGESGPPFDATLRLVGRRVGLTKAAGPRDTFTHTEVLGGIVPGSGPVSVTSTVLDLEAGEWTVQAQLVRPETPSRPGRPTRSEPLVIERARWSWPRWTVSTAPQTPVKTRWALIAPLAATPGVLPGSFTVLGLVAVVLALMIQGQLLGARGLPVESALAVSIAAIVAGLLGAKAWSRVLHPGEALIGPGWAVDGFLVVAPLVAVAGASVVGLPLGIYLDASAPAIFMAVAVGRIGCFVTGCCAGQCTSARFGIWSSDRRIGARRVPTQLMESATGLALGSVSLAVLVSRALPIDGLVFVAALLGYLAIRQFLLRIRAEPRRYLWQRSKTLVQSPA